MTNDLPIQPTINMGIVGHVDHGKTTLTKLLSGKWTDTHSEEKKRGITIKLGYTNFTISKEGTQYNVANKGELLKRLSIVDAPGHESFMATMISGAAVMDCALLLVAANEKCPQPQTIEHLKTLEISGITKIIVIQNKIDLVTKEEALENYKEIKTFLDTTFAKDAPIMPMSAQHGANTSALLKVIEEKFDDPKRDLESTSRIHIVRSFDINKPGSSYTKLRGGVIGGSLKQGTLKVGEEIEIRPGLMKKTSTGVSYTPIFAKVEGLMSDKDKLVEAGPGGSIAIMTKLDPVLTKTDSLVGQIAGPVGTLAEPIESLKFSPELFEKIMASTEEHIIKDIYKGEPLMMIVNSMTTVGIVSSANTKEVTVKLKKPVMAFEDDKVVIFRRFTGNKWRIIGCGSVNE
jgi:translation initiation factor 2 subunit 3